MTKLTIEYSDSPAEHDLRTLIDGLVAYNSAHAPSEQWQGVVLFLRTSDVEVVGGLNGMTHWGWLFVKHLWVHENYQREGYGSELLKRAENVARERACTNAYLDTFDFQALPFYKKNGYQVYAQLENFPKGHTRYFLEKRGL